MSQTVITHDNDIPDYRGGLLTATEYALIEGGALSGRASINNALVRNGNLDGRWHDRPASAPARSVDLGRLLMTVIWTVLAVWLVVGVVVIFWIRK